MRRNAVVFGLLLSCFSRSLWGQHAVDPGQRYHRLICLVHLTGSGKTGDEIRPEYAPSPAAMAAATTPVPVTGSLPGVKSEAVQGDGTAPVSAAPAAGGAAGRGIIAWSFTPTDDGKMAIIHVVAVDRNALAPMLADKRSEVRVFEIGVDKPEAIEKEMKKYKKDFTLDSLQVVAR